MEIGGAVSDSRDRRNDRQTASLGTSRTLLARARARDGDAWRQLIDLYAPLVLHWCRRARVPSEEMPDLFQEVFAAAARGLPSFRKTKARDTFRGWLRTIARNKISDHFRRRVPRGVGGSEALLRISQLAEPPALEVDSAADRPIEIELLQRALARTRPHFQAQTWQAFWRTVVDGQSAVDVAVELSLSPGAVRVAKSRVLHRLRSELADLPE